MQEFVENVDCLNETVIGKFTKTKQMKMTTTKTMNTYVQ